MEVRKPIVWEVTSKCETDTVVEVLYDEEVLIVGRDEYHVLGKI